MRVLISLYRNILWDNIDQICRMWAAVTPRVSTTVPVFVQFLTGSRNRHSAIDHRSVMDIQRGSNEICCQGNTNKLFQWLDSFLSCFCLKRCIYWFIERSRFTNSICRWLGWRNCCCKETGSCSLVDNRWRWRYVHFRTDRASLALACRRSADWCRDVCFICLFQRSFTDLFVKRVHSAQILETELCDTLDFSSRWVLLSHWRLLDIIWTCLKATRIKSSCWS